MCASWPISNALIWPNCFQRSRRDQASSTTCCRNRSSSTSGLAASADSSGLLKCAEAARMSVAIRSMNERSPVRNGNNEARRASDLRQVERQPRNVVAAQLFGRYCSLDQQRRIRRWQLNPRDLRIGAAASTSRAGGIARIISQPITAATCRPIETAQVERPRHAGIGSSSRSNRGSPMRHLRHRPATIGRHARDTPHIRRRRFRAAWALHRSRRKMRHRHEEPDVAEQPPRPEVQGGTAHRQRAAPANIGLRIIA